jgi:long-chain acyl-CoA synthetase
MKCLESFADYVDGIASRAGTRIAVKEERRDWTYTDLIDFSKEISKCLESLGHKAGHRVGLLLPNSGAFIASFLGIARIGGVIAPMNVRYRSQELRYYSEDIQPLALIITTDAVPEVQKALTTFVNPPALLAIDLNENRCCVIQRGGIAPEPVRFADAPPLLHQYSSGSTGAPKRIIRTHANIFFELENLSRTFDVCENDRFLGAAPFSHVNGLVRTMMTAMFVGATVYPVREFRRQETLNILANERITYFGGVPHMFVTLAQMPLREKVDLSNLRIVFSSSAPLLPADNRHFHEKYGIYVRQLYGSTETGTISVNLHRNLEQCLESVGAPLKGILVDIVDGEGYPLPAEKEGEIVIASPGAIKTYPGNSEANSTSFRRGFYLSGDLGRKNAEGYVTLTGRKKFLINRGGYKVNPREVEEALQSHPNVEEVVVLGAAGLYGDEIVRCVIVTTGSCTKEELVRHCQSRIADFKIPSRIEFRKALPKTETGKILRQML